MTGNVFEKGILKLLSEDLLKSISQCSGTQIAGVVSGDKRIDV